MLVQKTGVLILFSELLAPFDVYHLQWLSPDGRETLLDHFFFFFFFFFLWSLNDF